MAKKTKAKNNKQNVNFNSGNKKKKQDPMIVAVCVFGAAVLVALPVIGFLLSRGGSGSTKPTVSTENSAGWNSIDGRMIYIDPETHEKVQGLHEIDGKMYFFDANGGITPGWTTYDDNLVYVTKEGTLATGIYKIGSQVFYFDEETYAMFTGFKVVDGKVYCFRDDGQAMTGFQNIEGNDYYFNNDGEMQTGWFEADGKNYYADEDGQLARGWKILDDGTHYFTDDFSAASGELRVDDTLYNFDEFDCPDQSAEVTTTAVTTEAVTEAVTTAAEENPSEKPSDKPSETPSSNPEPEKPSVPDGHKQFFNDKGEPLKGLNEIDGKKYFLDDNG
ncbi:MAG: hypothetical protein IKH50_05885, partial [Oscillospiraceae bacterium]|nr:hypothetical protein [Oscillospiraceae bacterium]